jgi:hypothetical protein
MSSQNQPAALIEAAPLAQPLEPVAGMTPAPNATPGIAGVLDLFKDENGSFSISRVQMVGACALILAFEMTSLVTTQKLAPIPEELLAWSGLSGAQYLGAKFMTGWQIFAEAKKALGNAR